MMSVEYAKSAIHEACFGGHKICEKRITKGDFFLLRTQALGILHIVQEVPDPTNLELFCEVNGQQRQRGHTGDMIFKPPQLIAEISKVFTLEPGDLILTGTPEGVGPIEANQG